MGPAHTGPVFKGPVLAPLTGDDPATVSGHRLTARLGSGAAGTTYLAHGPGGQPLALTVLRPGPADADFATRFHHATQAAGRVRSPYTVPVVGSGKEGERYWVASAYQPGLTLRAAVEGGGPLPTGVVLRLVADLAEGLQAVHHAGLVHGALRPAHVLLAAQGPLLKSYGLGGLTQPAAADGYDEAAAFRTPEQAAGRPAVPATDVFALGEIAAYASIGTPPFGEGRNVREAEADLNELPGELREIVTRCLIKDPALRPSLAQITAMCTQAAPKSRLPSWLPAPLLTAVLHTLPPPQHPPTPGPPPQGAGVLPHASPGGTEPAAPPARGGGVPPHAAVAAGPPAAPSGLPPRPPEAGAAAPYGAAPAEQDSPEVTAGATPAPPPEVDHSAPAAGEPPVREGNPGGGDAAEPPGPADLQQAPAAPVSAPAEPQPSAADAVTDAQRAPAAGSFTPPEPPDAQPGPAAAPFVPDESAGPDAGPGGQPPAGAAASHARLGARPPANAGPFAVGEAVPAGSAAAGAQLPPPAPPFGAGEPPGVPPAVTPGGLGGIPAAPSQPPYPAHEPGFLWHPAQWPRAPYVHVPLPLPRRRRRAAGVVGAVAVAAVAVTAGVVFIGGTGGSQAAPPVGAVPRSTGSVGGTPAPPGATPSGPGGDATGAPEPGGQPGSAYRGIRLPAGDSVALDSSPPTVRPGTYSGDFGLTQDAQTFAVEMHRGTLAVLAPGAAAGKAACEAPAAAQVTSVARDALTAGARMCVRVADGTVALVTFRQLPQPAGREPAAVLDVTVWRAVRTNAGPAGQFGVNFADGVARAPRGGVN